VDEPPPGPVRTLEDEQDDDPAAPVEGSAENARRGPPGGRVFSLEDRPTPALYLIGWLLSGAGLAAILIALLASAPLSPLMALIGVVLLGVGLSVAAGYQLVARAARPPHAYRGPSPLILFGVVLAASTVIGVLLGFARIDPARPIGFLLYLSVTFISYVGVVWLFVVRSGALRWRWMGWPGWPVDARYAVGRFLADVAYGAALMVPTLLAAAILGSVVSRLLGVEPTQVLPKAVSASDRILVAAAAAIVAPIGEELFFRGFVLTAWLRDLGPRAALIRSSLLFALVHIANVEVAPGQAAAGAGQALVQFVVILPVGIVLGLLFLQRGIVAAIVGHMTYNGIGLVLLLAVGDAPTG
jgi:hypothetical protein